MVGLTLARLLRARGHDPVVLERAPAGVHGARGFMLGYQGFDAFQELGVLERLRRAGRDVGTGPNGVPIGIAVDYGIVMATLAEDVPVAHGESVVALIRDGDRVVGVECEGPGGRARVPADLSSPATAADRPCGRWRASRRSSPRSTTPTSPSSARWRPGSCSASATCPTAA